MIEIVHVELHCNDQSKVTAIEIKLKSFDTNKEDKILSGHYLAATVSVAFLKTTLLTDSGKSFNMEPNTKRNNVVNLFINLKEYLTFTNVANFLNTFQKTLNETNLFDPSLF